MKLTIVHFLVIILLAGTTAIVRADLASLLAPIKLLEKKQVQEESEEVSKTEEITPIEVQLEKENIETKLFFLTEDDLLPVLQILLEEKFRINGDFRIYPMRPWKSLALPDSDWKLEIIGYPLTGITSKIIINFRIRSGEEFNGDWQLPIRCEIWQEVFIPKSRLNRGDPINLEYFDVKSADILRCRYPPLPVDIDLADYELAQTVTPNSPLMWRNLAAKPLIRKGQIVDVTATEGMLSIKMKGLAMENGAYGDFIIVRNLQSRKNVQAQVVNGYKVKVFF